MLHEVLLSLWGCSTNVLEILETNPVDLKKYLHPGERALLKKILDIVKECNVIRNFIQEYTFNITRSSEKLQNLPQGLYLQALCEGMDQALEPFREEIVDLENVVLHDSYTPLSLILCRVQKYTGLFSVLNSIIREINTQKIHGCKLLQCLHQNMHTGIPEVKSALEKMSLCIHTVLYKQLTSWLLYGHLEDMHNEFFIQKISEGQNSLILADNEHNAAETKSIKFNSDMWDYIVQMDMLPSYIRPSLATKILTIGQTIIMFGNDPRQKKDFATDDQNEISIWGDKKYEYFLKIQNLQKDPIFNIVAFERTIDELKQCVTELLWRVAVEESQLVHQLKLVKDFFLMGRGDLFLEFIRLTAHILNKPPTNHTSRDINLAFQIALRNMHLNDETAMESFNFLVPIPTEDSDDTEAEGTEITDKEREDPIEKRGWGMIILKYKVIWPLHLLFSPSALIDYNTLFRFLLRVKKTQIDLWNLWSEHMYYKNIDIGVIQLRNNLIFIIDNLQYYLQVDVLESQYTIMEANMKNTRNFEDVQKAHSIFLANVMSQTFLLGNTTERKNPVNKLIKLLLRLCDDFILQASMWEVGNLLLTEKEELKTLSDTLGSLMSWLTKTLNRVRAQPSGEHLAQLLLRLDFNRWFSKKI
ncbi:gamma-tubulin complex component 4 [Nomia melanderi]|uniref:gamma-tubulin complex component 4 n=1 Tax=Nomia melanderi TaxID=2448451 RepID=UPI001303F826|nr:gamma-tubulin complex component 4 [Nomia melanderi]XP_031831424.1 gamma-tubulin complex component 4 [Nomia melanderi]XP_031831425.1 gamma-tubulin complex component 4 [Nomia melanderi]XP_031831426.1 gamma-tubulin complex component 4 [Nomia melanderi]XP_031831427.1 gamma-tubulin complex component 4 [Nomia melanderi]XP_031831428.1 gamma-tubulin complex component 4 [Nomia melanderi]XP_031831429.1 gamma-tubulin complex component 4 [Nomia melanderi]XP_031831430.1 gamma-tubulin complex component